MSFEITFDGSLVNNRNVPEVIASSSLIEDTTQTFVASGDPSGGEFNSGSSVIFKPDGNDLNDGNPANNTGIYNNWFSGASVTIYNNSIGGGVLDYAANPFEFTYIAGNTALAGTPVTLSYSFTINSVAYPSSGMPAPNTPSGIFQFISFIGIQPFPSDVAINRFGNFSGTVSGNFAPSGSSDAGMAGIIIVLGDPYWLSIDYIRITQGGSNPVTIAEITDTQGANKTGGTPTTTTVQTLQDGSPAISGPANRFGLNVRDNGTTKLAPQFFPSALNTEESSATITEEKEITADSTSLSVEGTGLGGTEKLERGSSVIVEDVTSYGDN